MPSVSKDDLKSLLMGGAGALCLALLLIAGYLSFVMGRGQQATPAQQTQEDRARFLAEVESSGAPAQQTQEERAEFLESLQ